MGHEEQHDWDWIVLLAALTGHLVDLVDVAVARLLVFVLLIGMMCLGRLTWWSVHVQHDVLHGCSE